MNDTLPRVSIIVPCRNEGPHIEACVESLLAQSLPSGRIEVIAADGASDDDTREVLRRLAEKDPRLSVLDNPGRIVSTGLNAAIRAARGAIILRADAHTDYGADYVRECAAVLEETGADNVGGPWIATGNGLVGQAIAAAFQSRFAVGGARGHDPSYEGTVDTVYLGCWRREVFDRVGLFDEELVRNQDDEFNLRLTRAGGRIWQSPRIKSRYNSRTSFRDLFRQQAQYGYWKVRVIRKHRLPASVRHLIPACFVLALILLPCLMPWWSAAGLTWFALLGLYTACSIIAAFGAGARKGWKLLPFLPPAFACYHVGYGVGFLRGILDFVILRRKPGAVHTELTRPTTDTLSRTARADG